MGDVRGPHEARRKWWRCSKTRRTQRYQQHSMGSLLRWRVGGYTHRNTDGGLNNGDGCGSGDWLMVFGDGAGDHGVGATTMVTVQSGGGRRGRPPTHGDLGPPRTRVAAVLPGLANAPREAALEDRGFAVEGLAEFWAAAAAAAKVARFCNCRALIPGERSQRGWCQTFGGRLRLRRGLGLAWMEPGTVHQRTEGLNTEYKPPRLVSEGEREYQRSVPGNNPLL